MLASSLVARNPVVFMDWHQHTDRLRQRVCVECPYSNPVLWVSGPRLEQNRGLVVTGGHRMWGIAKVIKSAKPVEYLSHRPRIYLGLVSVAYEG